MKENQFREQLSQQAPEVPELFSMRMEKTLERIVIQEANMKESTKEALRTGCRISRRTIAIALALMISLGAFAYAATQWNLFDSLSFMVGNNTPVNADKIMQSNLAHETVNGVDIDVQEAGYDGKTLFIRYAYKMNDVNTPLGMHRTGKEGDGVSEEDMTLLTNHRVGWWIDHLWINGKCVDMPNSSGAITSGSTTPGELIQTEYWRLDNEGIMLNDKVNISLPIGERQSLSDYTKADHPEMYTDDGELKEPSKGIVTFTLDTTGVENLVRIENPNIPFASEKGTVQVSEVCYSPLMTYITLKIDGSSDALSAYKEKNGEGYTDENGNLMWSFSTMDIYTEWLTSLELVDGNGQQLFPGHYGSNGYGDTWAEYDYPYIENVPDELYLAPIVNGVADMTQAVKVK